MSNVVTSYTKNAIDDGLLDVRAAVRASAFDASPSRTAAQNTASIKAAVEAANVYGLPVQIDQDLPVNELSFTTENVRLIGPGTLIQQKGQRVLNIQRPWGPAINCFAPTLMKYGADGVQGSAYASILSVDGGGYNRFQNGDAFNISSSDTYPWDTAGSPIAKSGMFTILGIGLTVNSISNGGPLEGVVVSGNLSGSKGVIQSVVSESGTVSHVTFSSLNSDFINGENLFVQTGGSSALTPGTVVGVAGVMYLVKSGLPFVDSYTNNVKIRKIDRSIITKLDIRVSAVSWNAYEPADQRKEAVRISGAYDVDVKMAVNGVWSQALILNSCYYGRYDSTVDGAPNHPDAEQGAYGYGVCIQGSSEELDGKIRVRNVRHGHTTAVNKTSAWSADGKKTLPDSSVIDVYQDWGVPKYCRCTGTGSDCTSSVFHTNVGAMFFEFSKATARSHSGMGRSGSTSRALFWDLGIGTRYYDCHARGGGFSDGGNIHNTGYRYQRVYKGCTTVDAPQYGLQQLSPSAADSSSGFWQELIVEDCAFHLDGTTVPNTTQRPIILSTGDAKIRNTSVSNFNDCPVYISSTNANGIYRFYNFSADYTRGPGRKPFQIAGTVDIFVDYYVDLPTSGLSSLFESVSGSTNIFITDVKRLGSGLMPQLLLNTSGSGQITYRGFRLIRRVTSPGDADLTVDFSGSSSVIRYNTPLTVTRKVTLPADNISLNGDCVKVVRSSGASNVTGTRYVEVYTAGNVKLASLEAGQTAEFRFDGMSWYLEDIKAPTGSNGALAETLLTAGTETIPRDNVLSYISMTSGLLRLTYYTHRKTETVTRMRVLSGTTAAVATPTLVKLALFSIDPATGNLTRIAVTANDTSTFAAINTIYTKNFLSSVELVQGTRYAIGILLISSVAVPTVSGVIPTLPFFEIGGTDPTLAKTVSGQTDIQASYTAASLTDNNNRIYAVVRP